MVYDENVNSKGAVGFSCSALFGYGETPAGLTVVKKRINEKEREK